MDELCSLHAMEPMSHAIHNLFLTQGTQTCPLYNYNTMSLNEGKPIKRYPLMFNTAAISCLISGWAVKVRDKTSVTSI